MNILISYPGSDSNGGSYVSHGPLFSCGIDRFQYVSSCSTPFSDWPVLKRWSNPDKKLVLLKDMLRAISANGILKLSEIIDNNSLRVNL